MTIQELIVKAENNQPLTLDELNFLKEYDLHELLEASNKLTKLAFKSDFHLCSIVNAKSGKCSEDCKWCAQSGHYETGSEEYNIVDPEESMRLAVRNAKNKVDRFSFVASGRTASNRYIKDIKKQMDDIKDKTDLNLCASMGLLNKEQLQSIYESGITRYHCNIETAPSYFKEVCTTHEIDEKLKTIQTAKDLGMTVCSGVIIGMGETVDHRIEAMMLLREMEIDSIPINILSPIKGTPLADAKSLDYEEILRTIAMFRFANPKSWLRFAGGRTNIVDIQDQAIFAGINSAIVGDLLTTEGLSLEQDIEKLTKISKEVLS